MRLLKSVASLDRVHATLAMHLPALALALGLLFTLSPITTSAQAENLDEVRSQIAAGNYDQALATLERFLSSDPAHAQGRFLKGIILTEQDRTDAAIEVFAQLASEYPDLPEPHNNLAVLYASRGEYVKARDSLLLAINTHPSYATAHENLGDIYAKMAGLAYDKALQLDRKNESAKAKLALMHDLISIDEPSAAGTTQVAMTETSETAPETEMEPVPSEILQTALGTVQQWAEAWSAQDVDRYLTFYASSFAPADGASRAQWASLRGQRLKKPRFIRIGIDETNVNLLSDNRVRVTFLQSYQSDTYGDRVRKALVMMLDGSQWKIVGEATIE